CHTHLFPACYDLRPVLGKLALRAMDALALLSAQFELPARLEGDRCRGPVQRHDTARLQNRLPFITLSKAAQDLFDPSGKRNGMPVGGADGDLLVFRADTPGLPGFARRLEIVDELLVPLDRHLCARVGYVL